MALVALGLDTDLPIFAPSPIFPELVGTLELSTLGNHSFVGIMERRFQRFNPLRVLTILQKFETWQKNLEIVSWQPYLLEDDLIGIFIDHRPKPAA